MRRWLYLCVCLFSPFPLLAGSLFYVERGETIYLSPESAASPRSQSSETASAWYRTSNGHRVMIASGVLVGLHQGNQPDAIFREFPAIVSWEKLMGDIYLLTLSDSADQFELSRDLLVNSAVKYAHPNLIREQGAR